MSFLKIITPKNIRSLCLVKRHFFQNVTHNKFSTRVPELVPVHQKAVNFFDRLALRDEKGKYTYGNIYSAAAELSKEISKKIDTRVNAQILFLCPNDSTYVITQWAIWMSGHVAVPVSNLHPRELIEYYVEDSECDLLITTTEYTELMQKVSANTSKKLMILDEKLQENTLTNTSSNLSEHPNVDNNKNAMIVYTSGTTGKPKGVVFTHNNIISQINTLLEAWRWKPDDVILHVLPLNHVHGIVNALLCPLYVGAKCVMLPKFNSSDVWSHLLGVNATDHKKITLFMAVPTIYAKLIQEYESVFEKDEKMKEYIKTSLTSKIRLMVSGSASLPVPIHNRWFEITGHKLLERYGMSEIGMCLSQEYDSERIPGYVGVPLNGCSVRIANQMKDGTYKTILECTNENKIDLKFYTEITTDTSIVGELLVKGNNVFKEYYNKPELTKKEFTSDNWFITGDTCKYSVKMKLFKMLGRTNIDIIKTGGYKVSSLQIETQLLGHPDVLDCTVVGIPDPEYGQIIAAVIVLKNENLTVDALKEWIRSKIPSYSVPRTYTIVKSIPKNTLGKVNKKELILDMFSDKS